MAIQRTVVPDPVSGSMGTERPVETFELSDDSLGQSNSGLLARGLQAQNGVIKVEGELVGDNKPREHTALLGRLQAEVEESLLEKPEGRR
jgi:hypothetical protein